MKTIDKQKQFWLYNINPFLGYAMPKKDYTKVKDKTPYELYVKDLKKK